MERWEENAGYSPSTIAAEIAGLYLASKIASADGDSSHAAAFQSTADGWASQVIARTYTTTGRTGTTSTSCGSARMVIRTTTPASPSLTAAAPTGAPAGDTPGTPTMSMSALNWALSMYIQLVAAEYRQQHGIGGLPGMPADVYSHYAGAAKPAVTTSPSPPSAGQQVTVRYAGWLAASASSITMHWGHDGWQGITDMPMTRQPDGSWTATVTVPVGTGLNTAYFNQNAQWDNNGGANYDIAAR